MIIGKINPMDSRDPRADPDITGQHREEGTYVILPGSAEEVLPDQTVIRDHIAMEVGLEACQKAKTLKIAQEIERNRQKGQKATWQRKSTE